MRILVVEDEPLLAEAIVELLAGEGHAVDRAATGLLAQVRRLAPPEGE